MIKLYKIKSKCKESDRMIELEENTRLLENMSEKIKDLGESL